MAKPTAKKVIKKKEKKSIPVGIVHIDATFNNTIVTFTDTRGNAVSWASSGQSGFKGSRKSTPFAAQVAAETAAHKARECGMRTVGIYVKGPGSGREQAMRAVANTGMRVAFIRDITPSRTMAAGRLSAAACKRHKEEFQWLNILKLSAASAAVRGASSF